MPIVAPFRGIRYNPEKVGDLNNVITQPYDKITPKMRDQYYEASEHNFVRLIVNRDANPYESSKATCDGWLADGVLRKDRQPAIYPYRQVFRINGHSRIRRGVVCLCKLEPLEGGLVLPHERTLSKPKEDRLNLMRTTAKQFEQVFMLYSDSKGQVGDVLAPIWKWKPELEATDEYGTTHCLWAITDEQTIRAVRSAMKPKAFVIADGHHRYETALNYRDEMRRKIGASTGKEAFNYRLVTCVNLEDPALVILPTHRLLSNIPEFNLNALLAESQRYFSITTRVPSSEIPRYLSQSTIRRGRAIHNFVLYAGPEKIYLFTLKNEADIASLFPTERSADYRALDVAILHTVFIESLLGVKPENIENHVSYERKWKNALAEVDRGAAQFALLIHPTRPEQVKKIAENWERMPQKSTDFYPKLISGMVFFDTDEHEMIS